MGSLQVLLLQIQLQWTFMAIPCVNICFHSSAVKFQEWDCWVIWQICLSLWEITEYLLVKDSLLRVTDRRVRWWIEIFEEEETSFETYDSFPKKPIKYLLLRLFYCTPNKNIYVHWISLSNIKYQIFQISLYFEEDVSRLPRVHHASDCAHLYHSINV